MSKHCSQTSCRYYVKQVIWSYKLAFPIIWQALTSSWRSRAIKKRYLYLMILGRNTQTEITIEWDIYIMSKTLRQQNKLSMNIRYTAVPREPLLRIGYGLSIISSEVACHCPDTVGSQKLPSQRFCDYIINIRKLSSQFPSINVYTVMTVSTKISLFATQYLHNLAKTELILKFGIVR